MLRAEFVCFEKKIGTWSFKKSRSVFLVTKSSRILLTTEAAFCEVIIGLNEDKSSGHQGSSGYF